MSTRIGNITKRADACNHEIATVQTIVDDQVSTLNSQVEPISTQFDKLHT